MTAYRTPGVYFEWLDSAERPVLVPERTDVTGFVGIAARGPLHRAVKVESWTQFQSVFGGFLPQSYLAYAVDGFFANGGRTCWIVRVADPDTARPASLVVWDRPNPRGENRDAVALLRLVATSRLPRDSGTLTNPAPRPALSQGERRPCVLDPGVWAHALTVRISPSGADRFMLTLRLPDGTLEQWPDLSMMKQGDLRQRYIVDVVNDVNDGSRLVSVQDLRPPERQGDALPLPILDPGGATPAGGADGLLTLAPKHYSGEVVDGSGPWGLAALETIEDVGLVVMPDLMPQPMPTVTYRTPPVLCDAPRDATAPPLPPSFPLEVPPRLFADQVLELQRALIRHCERKGERMALLDAPPLTPELGPAPLLDASEIMSYRRQFDTEYAALYYPWLLVPDPLESAGTLRAVPPSGHVAGVFARVETTLGPHKPPANEPLDHVDDVTADVDPETHGALNEMGINVLRAFPARGIRVAGARTLSDLPDYRFVNVRRLVFMIERAINVQTQWIPFEPHNLGLRIELDRVVRGFLDGLWRRGMLDGATPDLAYFVRCDETTNPEAETAAGRIICEIGIQPPWPAEFVVVRIGKTEAGAQVLQQSGATHA
jgi:hypothetical protein